jgi:hypothetical protein
MSVPERRSKKNVQGPFQGPFGYSDTVVGRFWKPCKKPWQKQNRGFIFAGGDLRTVSRGTLKNFRPANGFL